jgi:FtsP/CotA-like multicopper oxidase with cupredoxin domain
MKVKPRVYRFRILNGSLARSFRHKLSTGDPWHVVATDGGLVPKVQQVQTFRHGGAERYEVLVDFRRFAPGTTITWTNLSNANNRDFDHTGKVMRFTVVADSDPVPDTYVIPGTLDRGPVPEVEYGAIDTMLLTERMAKRRRFLDLEHDDVTNDFLINGSSWRDVEEAKFEPVLSSPAQNDVEVWTIENKSGGWFHPLHIHLVDFKILSRNGRPPLAHELGPKDVVYVGEGEIVKVVMQFHLPKGNSGGRYMIHCHNLPHEDHDMMQQFKVTGPGYDDDVNDPMDGAKPESDNLDPDVPAYDPAYDFPVGT